jgi:hypothetical protein
MVLEVGLGEIIQAELAEQELLGKEIPAGVLHQQTAQAVEVGLLLPEKIQLATQERLLDQTVETELRHRFLGRP